jgi:uncharacterized protein (TIGR02145 family)
MKRWNPALLLIASTLAFSATEKAKPTSKSASKPTSAPATKPMPKPAAKPAAPAATKPSEKRASAAPQVPRIPTTRGNLTDSRDGATYKTVTIGKQTWMAQNLGFAADGSMCFENRKERCEQFGRLYDWSTARKACPSGWRLPSDADWKEFEKLLGAADSAGWLLKTTSGWSTNGNGVDAAGFAAIAAGNSDKTGVFNNLEFSATFWTSTKKFMGDPWYRRMRFDETSIERETSEPSYLFSVRCVKEGH